MPQRYYYRRIVEETFRTYRKRANLTQEKLAERADLHHNFICEAEPGNMEISLGSLLNIAEPLGIRGRDFLRDL